MSNTPPDEKIFTRRGLLIGASAAALPLTSTAFAYNAVQGSGETLNNTRFSGSASFFTDGGRIGITSESAPLVPTALVQIVNKRISTAQRVSSFWEGSGAVPYQNNDNALLETFNRVLSNSANYSWSLSAPNAYNDIPFGVIDSGERVGVYGWATSVNIPGAFVHAGTLSSQVGVKGRAGFQGAGNPQSAVIRNAIGVKGEIYAESLGSTIENATAGHFTSVPSHSTILNNIAIYAAATQGKELNYSFYGDQGQFFNRDQIIIGDSIIAAQSEAMVSVRGVNNSVEFGHPDPSGYSSNLGSTSPHGLPFLALCAEADPYFDSFTTRGKKGVLVYTDLTGRLIFGRIPNSNAQRQAPVEMGAFTADGHFKLAETMYIRSRTPLASSSPGVRGEFAWDENYLYICVATNTWKRTAISTW